MSAARAETDTQNGLFRAETSVSNIADRRLARAGLHFDEVYFDAFFLVADAANASDRVRATVQEHRTAHLRGPQTRPCSERFVLRLGFSTAVRAFSEIAPDTGCGGRLRPELHLGKGIAIIPGT